MRATTLTPARGRLALLSLGALVVAFADAPLVLAAASGTALEPLYFFGVPVDFILFGLTLLGVVFFHHHTLLVALTGVITIAFYKIVFTGFNTVTASPATWDTRQLSSPTCSAC
jgi:hypothetical protein